MLVIGITGGIGSGKGVATEFFQRRGAEIVDADEIARELTQPHCPLVAEIASAFGAEVVRGDGSLDRKRLAQLVFSDADALARINALTHPPIMAEVKRRVEEAAGAGGKRMACVVAPLLLEAGGRDLVDRLLVMWAEEGERVRRVMERDGLSEDEVRQRMAAQMPAEEQRGQADWVVDTTPGLGRTKQQLEKIWEELNQ